MKYFLDSAITSEIEYALENWGIDGVTTNPRHIQVSGKPFYTVIKEIANITKDIPGFTVSVEVNPHFRKAEDMIDMAKKLAGISPNFVIKIPCIEQGICAAYKLEKMKIRTNVTLVFSAAQAIMAGRLGAKFVSPFIAWKEEAGEDTRQYIEDIVTIYRNYNYKTEIIVAALRNGRQIVDAARAGAHIVTAGFDIFKASFEHPFTVGKGIPLFEEFWDKTDTN